MRLHRIPAMAVIFVCTTIAWMILGATIFTRTYSAGHNLRDKVAAGWGGPHQQRTPTASYTVRTAERSVSRELPLASSRIDAELHLDHRQKGLLWYNTYAVAFRGAYRFHNPSAEPQDATFLLRLPARDAIYDDLLVSVNGAPIESLPDNQCLRVQARVEPAADAHIVLAYKSQGLDDWSYVFGSGLTQVRDFGLRVRTDFDRPDFPEGALSPTSKQRTGAGWHLEWAYKNLMTGRQIQVETPGKLQPGPVAGQISYFAPVSLLFFFFVLFLVTTLRGIDLHPVNYFFLAVAFFAFHLLFAYLVDHVQLHIAFVISSVVSIALVVSYLRLVVSTRFACREAAAIQFLYLVLFSYAFFWQGFTGLAVTIGAILTLFVTMQLTARARATEGVSN